MSNPTPPTTIEPAIPTDAPAIKSLIASAYSKYIPRLGREPAPMSADWGSLIESGDVWVLCADATPAADCAREVIGSVLLHISSPTSTSNPEVGALEGPGAILLLDDLVVSPDHQGKGYGRKLMGFAEGVAREKGCGRVRLYTNVKMWENMELYKKWEFLEVERRVEEGFERVFYEKRV